MKIETKAQIAKLTLTSLTWVGFLFMMGVLILVVCAGVGVNPFRETTTGFLMAVFAGLIGLSAILVMLNVATSISLIADAKIQELNLEPQPGRLKKWCAIFVGVSAIIVAFIFVTTYLSKEQYINVVQSQANEVMKENDPMLAEISQLLVTRSSTDMKRIKEICGFLENQRKDLPNLHIIYSGSFSGKITFYEVNENYPYVNDEKTETFKPQYFQCTRDVDCDYLKEFFAGGKVELMKKWGLRDENFKIYIPYYGKESRYVLFFDKQNYFGKMGS